MFILFLCIMKYLYELTKMTEEIQVKYKRKLLWAWRLWLKCWLWIKCENLGNRYSCLGFHTNAKLDMESIPHASYKRKEESWKKSLKYLWIYFNFMLAYNNTNSFFFFFFFPYYLWSLFAIINGLHRSNLKEAIYFKVLNELILNQGKTLTNGCLDNMFYLSPWPCVPSLMALCAKVYVW